MRILLIGKNGQLGSELQTSCRIFGELFSIDFPEIDLAKANDLRNLIQTIRPNLILNAAAYTNVDKAESEPELAHAVNTLAPAIMAEESKKINSVLIHYSTDYVYDGLKKSPYLEKDIPNPLNVYGMTKLEGDNLVDQVGGSSIILRTSWVYGLKRTSFVSRVLQWSRMEEEIKIVDDQIGSPTWARTLAESTAQLVDQGKSDLVEYFKENSGLFHLAGSGSVSRFEWAKAIIDLDPKRIDQKTKKIIRASTDDFPSPARRPNYSALNCEKIQKQFGLSIPDWKVSLSLALNTPMF
jgi:dTDP-4-dehydrorhamnose reductase